MYFPRDWEFGSASSKLRNFGGGVFEHPKPPLGMPLIKWFFVLCSTLKLVKNCWEKRPKIRHTGFDLFVDPAFDAGCD
jgi:hypothetical protein